MGSLSILFLGGTGTISSAVSDLVLARGHELTLLTRGTNSRHPVPDGAHHLRADARDPQAVSQALAGRRFDVVVDWLAFTPDHLRDDLALFADRTDQFVFISSASAYQTPPSRLPVTESTPLRNPFWEYSRNKIACEDLLVAAYRDQGFPATIVRPSHTYDHTGLPLHGGWTVVERTRAGRPIVVHGDGSSLWTLTDHRDFAVGFVGLLGDSRAIGEAFHITSDDVLTWDQISRAIGRAAGAEPRIVHVPSDAICAVDPGWGASLLGDKTHSMTFDNAKVRALVPDFAPSRRFESEVATTIAWFDADPARRAVDAEHDAVLDSLVERFGA